MEWYHFATYCTPHFNLSIDTTWKCTLVLFETNIRHNQSNGNQTSTNNVSVKLFFYYYLFHFVYVCTCFFLLCLSFYTLTISAYNTWARSRSIVTICSIYAMIKLWTIVCVYMWCCHDGKQFLGIIDCHLARFYSLNSNIIFLPHQIHIFFCVNFVDVITENSIGH